MAPPDARRPMPGARPGDHPGWRLAFEIWDSLRHDGWAPLCRLLLLIAPIIALAAAALLIEPWSLPVFLTVIGATATVVRGLSTRHHRDDR
jgi:hypothetical protein